MNVIETENLTKTYRNKLVLKNINLKVPEQSVYGLLGINGAGKSTLMKVLTGIITHYQGKLFFKGNEWDRNDLKRIGSLIEYPSLYDNLSIKDNFLIDCYEDRISSNRIEEVSNLLKIDYLNKKFKDCSLGMKQRAGIARALLKNPEFLVLDEPFNGLDPYGVNELKSILLKVKENGTSILISDHVLSDLEDISDFIGIINNAELVYQDKNVSDLEKIFFKYTQRRM
ncbi:MAG: ATP-binding cassette domain-containing protein [Firmicutes bacterium]|uniref:ATP-binding cassette domain-containing protein n=1 Tax=Candidatus Gallilactobacillus intestinavium TaxID=2840838 RepID=A0A9D9E6N1_9LACO|nr:ATP-binding cassette domain-containing protein [Candidatus Gallilactobacillus intestinavium]